MAETKHTLTSGRRRLVTLKRCGVWVAAVVAIIIGLALKMWPPGCCEELQKVQTDEKTGRDFCSPRTRNIDPKHLVDKGYVHIANWLDEDDLAYLKEAYAATPEQYEGLSGNYVGIKHPKNHQVYIFNNARGRKIMLRIWRLIDMLEATTHIRLRKGMKKDTVIPNNGGVFYHTNNTIGRTFRLPWHQDAETFWYRQDHVNTLKFYFFLDKASPFEAGVEIIPFDALATLSPSFHKYVLGNGGKSFMPTHGGKTFVADPTFDRPILLNFSIQDFRCSPEVHPRDLLVLRGDIIHRTQPHTSWRTSFNVYFWPVANNPSVSRIFTGGIEMLESVASSPVSWSWWAYERLAKNFPFMVDMLGQDVIRWGFLQSVNAGLLYRHALYPVRRALIPLVDKEAWLNCSGYPDEMLKCYKPDRSESVDNWIPQMNITEAAK